MHLSCTQKDIWMGKPKSLGTICEKWVFTTPTKKSILMGELKCYNTVCVGRGWQSDSANNFFPEVFFKRTNKKISYLIRFSHLCRFSEGEVKRLYRGFKTECPTGVLRFFLPSSKLNIVTRIFI